MRGVVAAALVVSACGPSAHHVLVDVRTDLSPAGELDGAHVTLETRAVDRLVAAGDDWVSGVRVADLDGIGPGDHRVVVALVHGGATVATRAVDFRVAGDTDTVVTVVVSRRCAGVVCPRAGDPASATTCADGTCTSPACGTPGAPACPTCHVDGDCMASTVACAPSRCLDGSCLRVPDATRCTTGATCDVASGCSAAAPVDAGAHDGGIADLGGHDADTWLGITCRACMHDSDCGPDTYCVVTGATQPAGCLHAFSAPPCPDPWVGPSTTERTSIDGHTDHYCEPRVPCTVFRAYGMDCPDVPMCGGAEGRCTSTMRCTFTCATDVQCPQIVPCIGGVCR